MTMLHIYRRFRLARRLTRSCINPSSSYFAQLWFDIRWALPQGQRTLHQVNRRIQSDQRTLRQRGFDLYRKELSK